MGFLAGALSPMLTAATQVGGQAEGAQVEANKMLIQRAIQARAMQHQMNLENFMAGRLKNQTTNTNSLVENRGATWKQAPDGSWHHLAADGSEVADDGTKPPTAGGSAPAPAAPDPNSPPPPTPPPVAGAGPITDENPGPVAGTPAFQGIVKHQNIDPNSKEGIAAAVAKAQGGAAARAQYKTTGAVDPGTKAKLAVLNNQINLSQRQYQAATNFMADDATKAMAPQIKAKLDSLTKVRDQVAGTVGPASPVADPTAGMSDADAWDYWVAHKTAPADATAKVKARKHGS